MENTYDAHKDHIRPNFHDLRKKNRDALGEDDIFILI